MVLSELLGHSGNNVKNKSITRQKAFLCMRKWSFLSLLLLVQLFGAPLFKAIYVKTHTPSIKSVPKGGKNFKSG